MPRVPLEMTQSGAIASRAAAVGANAGRERSDRAGRRAAHTTRALRPDRADPLRSRHAPGGGGKCARREDAATLGAFPPVAPLGLRARAAAAPRRPRGVPRRATGAATRWWCSSASIPRPPINPAASTPTSASDGSPPRRRPTRPPRSASSGSRPSCCARGCTSRSSPPRRPRRETRRSDPRSSSPSSNPRRNSASSSTITKTGAIA